MAKKTTTSKQLVVNKDGSVSQGTVTFNSKGQVQGTSGGGSSSTKITQDAGMDREQIAQRAVETTNSKFGGDPNIVAYGGTFTPSSGGYAPPATNDNYASVKPVQSSKLAQQDLVTKQQFYNDTIAGMQNQANQNNQVSQNTTTQTGLDNNAPSKTLDDIRNLVSGGASNQKQELANIGKKQDEAFTNYQNQLNQIRRGTFPLTPDQNAMVNYTQRQFDSLAEQQRTSNKNFEGAIAQLGISSGRSRYAPEIQTGLAKQAIDNGIAKLGDIEAKASMTIAQMRMGFQDKNYQLINDSYRAYNSYLNDKTQIINEMAGIVREEAQFALTLHNQEVQEKRQQFEDELNAQEFNLKYGVPKDKPFYAIAGTVFRSSDRKPAHDLEEYEAMGGRGDFSDVYQLDGDKVMERDLVASMIQKDPSAGILPSDSLAVASQKYKSAQYDPTNYSSSPEAVGFSTPPQGGFRTDRNNNPTAMTSDVAKSLGLVEGRDYIVGDKFPTGNLYTAKLLGDPIAVTIKGLDNAAQTGRGAFRTQGGKPRWNYVDMSDSEWLSLSPEEKQQVITSMYQREGGSGQLVGETSQDNPSSQKTISNTTAQKYGISSDITQEDFNTVRNSIIKAKNENPDMPYYDIWGKLSDSLKEQGVNPSDYDGLFWEILSPDGLKGRP